MSFDPTVLASLSIGIKQVAKEKKANLTRLTASFQDKRGMLVPES